MCLVAEKGSARIAKEDIRCWKAVSLNEDGSWGSAFLHNGRRFAFGEPAYEDSLRRAVYRRKSGTLEVGAGFFHACRERENCIFVVWNAANLFKYGKDESGDFRKELKLVICECVIPKGTRYYCDGVNYLAAKSIIVNEPADEPATIITRMPE